MAFRGRHTRSGDGERGAVAVEFALVLPLLLLVVFGAIQYGLYFWAVQGGSAAVRDGARRAAVGQLPGCGDFQTYVRNRLGSVGPATSTATVERTYTSVTGTPVTAAAAAPGDVVTVKVTFHSYDMKFPLIPMIKDGKVVQVADSRVEYVPTAPGACP